MTNDELRQAIEDARNHLNVLLAEQHRRAVGMPANMPVTIPMPAPFTHPITIYPTWAPRPAWEPPWTTTCDSSTQ